MAHSPFLGMGTETVILEANESSASIKEDSGGMSKAGVVLSAAEVLGKPEGVSCFLTLQSKACRKLGCCS